MKSFLLSSNHVKRESFSRNGKVKCLKEGRPTLNMSSLEGEKACFKTLRERGHFFLLELQQG